MKIEEVRVKVQVVQVKLKCPNCDIGFLEPYGDITYDTWPQGYPHKCSNNACGNTAAVSGKRYPYIEYQEII
jgi:hypothetical protein